jgi:hypothetical protein
MTVMIAKANQDIFKEIHPRIKFKERSTNTCVFNVTGEKFNEIRNKLREKGYNPFAIMYW